MNMFIQGVFS